MGLSKRENSITSSKDSSLKIFQKHFITITNIYNLDSAEKIINKSIKTKKFKEILLNQEYKNMKVIFIGIKV